MASERVQRQIDRLLDEVEEAISQFDWERVRQCAQAVLAIDPENADGLTFLATAERALSGSSAPMLPGLSPAPTTTTAPIAAPIHPSSFANGRYQVKRFLGEGGKKKVYLAHDTLLDWDVAFALIKTDGLDEAGRSRISREAQAMRRLGSHPHIVTVFDLGEEPSPRSESGSGQASQPYMVTELMGGGDVAGVVEDASDNRLPLEQAISITRETCQGLDCNASR